MRIHKFDCLKEGYGDVDVYISQISGGDKSIIAIPAWNWSFLIDYTMRPMESKRLLINSLSVPMFRKDAEILAESIFASIKK